MNYEELNSKITNIRCDLEELSMEVYELWKNTDADKFATILYELQNCLQDAADQISEWEDNEDLQEEMP